MTRAGTSPSPTGQELRRARLDLAGTRDFTVAGAGQVRRAAISSLTSDWLADTWAAAVGDRPGLALAAVGSLGRQDTGPLSDLDLVLLHDGRSRRDAEIAALADGLWYPIWDAGLRLDHSVRTAGECRAVAADDLVAAVGLLDLRHLAGDPELVSSVRASIAHDWRANARRRLPSLLEATEVRHRRHGELAQSGEPDLKEAKGGLRDLTVLTALQQAWLTDRDRGRVDDAYRVLLDVRDALHVTTGRDRARLAREEHDAVAALLGHPDADALLTSVSGAARVIAWSLDGAIRRAGQSQRARVLRVGPRRPTMVPLGYGVYRHDGEAVLGSTGRARVDPELPLRAAVVAARQDLPLAPQTLANLALAPDLPTPWPASARALLTDLLGAGPGLGVVWEGLDQVGVVERWFPEWAAVRSRPQRNAIHRHTVDRHLLESVGRAAERSRDVARPDLLLLGALLHDIGKVHGAHDHSVEGARIAAGVLERLGLPPEERATVVLLVREHLSLMEIATRRDLEDPATTRAVTDLVGQDAETFELLRALTIADAQAAGPKAWTDWRASLLATLTTQVRAALAREDRSSLAPDHEVPGSPVPAATAGAEHPFVRVEPSPGGGWTVVVHDSDRRGLFADTAGLLSAAGHVVRSARLRTEDGVAVDEWHVESPSGDAPDGPRLAMGLARLARGERTAPRAPGRSGRRPTGTRSGAPTRAFVVPTASAEVTVLEVRTADRPGLLRDLGHCLAEEGLGVRSAHISTHAGQTLDTFYVTADGGGPLSPAQVARTLASIIDTCDDLPGT